MKRDARRERDLIGATRAEGAEVNVGELAFPELAQRHFFRIECEADALGIAHADAAIANGTASAADLRHIAHAQLVRFAG